MKKSLLILALIAAMSSCTGRNSFKLTGKFEDTKDETVFLICSGQVMDSVFTPDGSFMFAGDARIPQLAYVSNSSNLREARKRCMFIIEPGTLTMQKKSDDGNQYTVIGTGSNALLAEYDKIEQELEQYYEENKEKEGIDDEIEERYLKVLSDQVAANFGNMYGLYCLSDLSYMQEPDKTRAMLDSFTDNVQKSKLWGTIDERNRKMLATVPGKQYMEFSQTDADGNVIYSKDVMADPANKYVLIDFWASWCGPCMQEVPFLTETYAKYHGKGFQILGVSLDMKRENWLGAIEKHGMNWIHVSDLKYWENEVARQYGVNSIPANFLVDCSNGQIIATGLRGKKLETKIAELLK